MEGLLELDRIGKLIAGKYRLELVLGRGGMGTVYRATHTWTGRAVAVKYLHPDHAQDTASVSRFLREARAAASVRHPNAVDVLDMGQDADGSAYLVLELLEGTTLADQIRAAKRLDPITTARLLVPVIEALEELHRVGVVHRDFKPANIFLSVTSRGHVVPKLLDFGVAKVLDENAGTATTTGIVVGTPAYMAPEQAAGNGEIGPWTDLWAVGAVVYQCLVGELPFMAPTPSLMLVDVMTKTAPKLGSRRPDLAPAVCAVVDRALTKDPKARFQTAAEMAEALCQATGFTPGTHTGPLQIVPAAGPSSVARAPKGALGPSNNPPTLPSSDTIQLSSDSMMVPTAPPEAPTVHATPASRPRSRPPAPVLLTESGRPPGDYAHAASEQHPEEKKQWTGPTATGRLQSPRPARVRLAVAVVASAAALAIGVWWSQGASRDVPAPPNAVAPHASAGTVPGAAGVSQPSSPVPTLAVSAAQAEVQKPALAEQPDASVAPAEGVVEPSRPVLADESEGGERETAERAPTQRPARKVKIAPAGVPAAVPPAGAISKQPETASPPRVVREW
jgi:serine/threonine protein kinase